MNSETKRKQRVRDIRTLEIMDAAELEFALRGFEGATVQGVADRAKLSKRQILYFFDSKDNLYRQVIDRIFTEWRSQDLEKWSGAPKVVISGYIDHIFDMVQDKPHRSKIIINEMMRGGDIAIPLMHDRGSLAAMGKTSRRLKSWMDQDQMRKASPLHFIFLLWGLQHFYVAFESEVAFFLGKTRLTERDWKEIRKEVKSAVMLHFS